MEHVCSLLPTLQHVFANQYGRQGPRHCGRQGHTLEFIPVLIHLHHSVRRGVFNDLAAIFGLPRLLHHPVTVFSHGKNPVLLPEVVLVHQKLRFRVLFNRFRVFDQFLEVNLATTLSFMVL